MLCCETCDTDRSAVVANDPYAVYHRSVNVSGATNPYAPHDLGPYCARLGCVRGGSCPLAAIVDARNKQLWTRENEDPDYSHSLLNYDELIEDLKRRFAEKGSLITVRDKTLDEY
jgi:hypothetical protein